MANVRLHDTTRERPVERFQKERSLLRPLPTIGFDTDEVVGDFEEPDPGIYDALCQDQDPLSDPDQDQAQPLDQDP